MGENGNELRDLECEKMRLEIADKKRPFWKQLESWKFAVVTVGTLGGVLLVISQLNSRANEAEKHLIAMERADLRREQAEFERKVALADRDIVNREADELKVENDISILAEKELRDQLSEVQARLEAAKAREKAAQRTAMKLQSIIDAQVGERTPPDGHYTEIAGLVTDYSGSPIPGIQVHIGEAEEETGPNGLYLVRIARKVTNVQVEFRGGGYLLGASYTSGAADSIVNFVVPKEAMSLQAARKNHTVKQQEADAKRNYEQRRLAQLWGNNETSELASKNSYLRSWHENVESTRAALHKDIRSFVSKYGNSETVDD